MHTTMVRMIAILLAVVMAFGAMPLALAAPQGMGMEELFFSIWPEYDTPDVLVIYSGAFVNNTGKTFTASDNTLSYYMPKGAKVNMVCETEKGMVCLRYQVDTSNPDYDKVIWRPSRDIQPGEKFPVMFEYNFNTFTTTGERKFTVPYQTPFDVKNLYVEVKQPLQSSNFQMTPASTFTEKDNQGFANYYLSFADVKAETKQSFDISYVRNELKPSVQPNQGSAQVGSEGGGFNSTVLILLIAFVGMLGLFLFYAMRTPATVAVGKGGRTPRAERTKATASKASGSAKPHGKTQSQPASAANDEKRKLRKLLLDGKISEDTYRKLVAELEEE